MITFRVAAEVKDDRQVLLTLPPDVPIGKMELVVSVATAAEAGRPKRSSLADWAEEHAEHWGDRINAANVETFTGRRY
jgi:hypothetical protein